MEEEPMRSPLRRKNARRRDGRNNILLLSLSLLLCFFAGEAAGRIFFWRETDTLHLRKKQESIEIGALIRPRALLLHRQQEETQEGSYRKQLKKAGRRQLGGDIMTMRRGEDSVKPGGREHRSTVRGFLLDLTPPYRLISHL